MNNFIQLNVSSKNEFHSLKDSIILSFIIILITIFMNQKLELGILLILFVFLSIFLLPTIIIHLNYRKFNKNKILIFQNDRLIFDNEIFLYDEIKDIKAIGSNYSLNNFRTAVIPYLNNLSSG